MKLEQLKSEIREEWKCTCDDCGHINDIYDMDDLMELITTAYNAGLKTERQKREEVVREERERIAELLYQIDADVSDVYYKVFNPNV